MRTLFRDSWIGISPFCALFLVLGLAGCDSDGLMAKVPVLRSLDKGLPESGAVPGLVRTAGPTVYTGGGMQSYLGTRAAFYIRYGALSMATARYSLGEPNNTLTIESYAMEDAVAAAGLYHFYRGRQLQNKGRTVAVGSEGVLDREHDGRNLYFYKQRYFFAIMYTAPPPIPDLTPLARAIAHGISGSSDTPEGFAYLRTEGIDPDSAYVYPGYTFNCDFLPPGIFAKAPGAGPIAEIFLLPHHDKKGAEETARDYRTYLALQGKNYDKSNDAHGRKFWQARQPDVGRVIFTRHRNYVIGVAWPKNYETARAFLSRFVGHMERERKAGR